MSWKRIPKSVREASRGLGRAWQHEQNFRIEIIAAVVAFFLCWYFRLPLWQLFVVILLVILVLTLELINTAIENVTDFLKPRLFPQAAFIKEIMAGAVLLAVVGSAFIGSLLFLPHFISLFR